LASGLAIDKCVLSIYIAWPGGIRELIDCRALQNESELKGRIAHCNVFNPAPSPGIIGFAS
jgi:hypothetical protein